MKREFTEKVWQIEGRQIMFSIPIIGTHGKEKHNNE